MDWDVIIVMIRFNVFKKDNLSQIQYQQVMRNQRSQKDKSEHLLEYIRTMLKRENLCNNTYLYKKMNTPLVVSIFTFFQENKITAISRNYNLITQALENSGLAKVINNKEVRFIQHPTVKISYDSFQGMKELEKILQEKEIKYELSKRYDSDDYVNLTIFGQDMLYLQKIIHTLDKELIYERVSLLQDMKYCVDRIRRLKSGHLKEKTSTGKSKYSINKPPETFVRKALDSSDSQGQQPHANGVNGKQSNGLKNKNRGDKKTKPKRQEKPNINNKEDFPTI